jgi:hypothetical protein
MRAAMLQLLVTSIAERRWQQQRQQQRQWQQQRQQAQLYTSA